MRPTATLGTELLKLRTTRTPVALATVAVLITAFLALQPIIRAGTAGAPSIGTSALLLAVLSAAARGQLIAAVIGVLAVTAERRHGTHTATLLQTPHRVRLLAAKSVAAALVALLLGLCNLAVVALAAISSGGLRGPLLNTEVVLAAVGQLLAYPLYGLLGVGIGALLMAFQPIAVLLPLAWFLVLENLLGAFARDLWRWLPGQLTAALANSGELPDALPIWVGALGLAGYGLVLVAIGATRLARDDIG